MGLFSWLFGSYSEKQIKKITPLVDAIEELADHFHSFSDDEMREYTDVLKAKLAEGKTLDDILPEAFALVREADERVLGKRPFRVQLMGGILLHQGRIAEMKTGEGKTLVATLPAYLNALKGEGVHIVTVNDYLARRDSEEMGRVYSYLGLSTGLIVSGATQEQKHAAYNADITYATNTELGFDYLRDNMVVYKEDIVQRGHAFAIVDEVDSILIDEARTPLIISGQSTKSTDLYERANELVRRMKRFVITEVDRKKDLDDYAEDYVVDEKSHSAFLTPNGAKKAESFFGIENLSDFENATILHHVNAAIKAYGVMRRDIDYVVKDNDVIIVDTFTGRLMPGRRYSDGLHQAIEAKEGVAVKNENRTIATITYQNFFKMYKKLSGMTGTALTEENEFRQIYNIDVVEVPTNKPMIRIDNNDIVYITRQGKLRAIIEQIKLCHAKGQPVLVGTVSIEKSEELAAMLAREKIPHVVLNAKHHEREAEIVAQAGSPGAVTISTNMAGRGTDILLGGNPEFLAKREMKKLGFDEELIAEANGSASTDDEELIKAREKFRELYRKYDLELADAREAVREAGGLFIIGTERHESRRIDNQLRGRSGRQGDPGESRFFLSFEDDLLRIFAGDKLTAVAEMFKLGDDDAIDIKLVSSLIENAQKNQENRHFEHRKSVLSYDDVMNQQRRVIYDERREVLTQESIQERITDMICSSVRTNAKEFFGSSNPEEWDFDGFRKYYRGMLTDKRGFTYSAEELRTLDIDALTEELVESALEIYEGKDHLLESLNIPGHIDMREQEKRVLLYHVTRCWTDHLESMDELRSYIGLNSYAQRDPVAMYRLEGGQLFDEMINEIKESTVKDILSLTVKTSNSTGRREDGVKITALGKVEKRQPVKKEKTPGPNDPCPCGSGEKYKRCCKRKNR